MSSVNEIERAIGELPIEQRIEIRRWLDTHLPLYQAVRPAVDWGQSAAVNRRREPETKLSAEVVMEALAAVRD